MKTAYLIEDEQVLRSLFREYFRIAVPEMSLIGEGENGHHGLAECKETAPDLVIVDLLLPDMDGYELALQIKEHHPETRVLIFSGSVTSETLRKILKSPIEGFLEKSDGVFQLRTAVDALKEGRRYFSPKAFPPGFHIESSGK